jgi:hypothetical protein
VFAHPLRVADMGDCTSEFSEDLPRWRGVPTEGPLTVMHGEPSSSGAHRGFEPHARRWAVAAVVVDVNAEVDFLYDDRRSGVQRVGQP